MLEDRLSVDWLNIESSVVVWLSTSLYVNCSSSDNSGVSFSVLKLIAKSFFFQPYVLVNWHVGRKVPGSKPTMAEFSKMV